MAEEKREELFVREFEQYKKENPNWEENLTDSTFCELMDWYDGRRVVGQVEDSSSEDAVDFADYVWYDILKHDRYPRLDVSFQISRKEMTMAFILAGKVLTDEQWEEMCSKPFSLDGNTTLKEENLMQLKLGIACVVAAESLEQ